MIEDLESGPPAAVSATGTHVMALAAGAVAIVALVASIASGSTIIPIASIAEGDRTTATVTSTPQALLFTRDGAPATPGVTSAPEWVHISGTPPPGVIVAVPVRVTRAPSCAEPARSPMEVLYRMFDLTVSGPTAFSECWTPGRAPKDPVLTSYIRARAPVSLSVDNVAMRFADGQLWAVVTARGRWVNDPPMDWANDAQRFVTLRQQPGGMWTIDWVSETAP